jgi:cell fate (sporulation/competence/biofilm development) regulator YmcA (YheA/YmcA/DUF963 family)
VLSLNLLQHWQADEAVEQTVNKVKELRAALDELV